ncbi:MAG: hypothetical protein ACRDP6_35970 [Actinoallomurus sp.]
MAKWREESGKPIKGAEDTPNPASGKTPPTTAEPSSARGTTAPARHERAAGRRARDGKTLRTGVRRASDVAANLVGVVATIICVLLALHIAFVVFSANDDNTIVRTVNDWAGWFAWRFHDIFVPKDERVGALVNYGIAATVYLIVGRVVSGLIRRIR